MKHVLLLLVLSAANYCYGQQVKYTSPEKDFSVIFPATPELSSDTVKLATGMSKCYYYMAELPKQLYSVSRTDILVSTTNMDLKELFIAVRDSWVEGRDVKDLQTLPIDTESKYPSIFFAFQEGEKVKYVQVYQYKSMQYVLLLICSINDGEPAAAKVFFDSFKILK